ncbi:hypothetical protein Q7Y16_06760 [Glaesserella parasuis]|nr:hypothetical protein [Glaesserella parasuis]
MIYAGFSSSLLIHYFSSNDRMELDSFFRCLIKYLYINCINNHKLISDRLYRKYIAKENIKDLCLLLDSIKIGFIGYLNSNSNSKFETYREYFRALNKISLDSLELLELGEDDVKIQIHLMLPYCIEEKKLPESFLDNLPNNAKPFWLREISMKEYVKKYST